MKKWGPDVRLDEVAFLHPSAHIYGKVTLREGVSMWPNTVIRAEMHEVEIGPFTNLQDFVMIHVGDHHPTRIGSHCSITHHCTIHGATIGDNCLIGINATVMDGCVIGDNCTIAGGSFLKEGTQIPDNSVVMGIPGKVTRRANLWVKNRFNAFLYLINAQAYARGNERAWSGEAFQMACREEWARLETEFAKRFPSE